MFKLLVILFILKLYARSNIFTYILGKYWQEETKLARTVEKYRTKISKIRCDIKFLITCKKNNLTPVFAKPHLVVKINSHVRQKITRTIIDAELKNKYKRKTELKKYLNNAEESLYNKIGFISKCALNSRISTTIRGKHIKWNFIHQNKLDSLFKSSSKNGTQTTRPFKSIIHNYSSYTLNAEEQYALSFGLEEPIPDRLSSNQVKTEFENFYQQVTKHTNHLSMNDKDELQSKLRRTCENYSKLKTPYKYKDIIKKLSQNNNIIILKQDKGRGVVILDKSTYVDKCLSLLNTDQFCKLDKDPTKTTESKVQRVLRSVKSQIGETEYKNIYPTGSIPGKLYGTAKVHKLAPNDTVDKLTLRPIISNIGTATYKTAKYLAKLLAPLTKSEYTVENTTDFVKRLKKEKIPKGYCMISFDVASLFTNVPLDRTIEIILKKIYDEQIVQTNIPRKEMKQLLLLCTKHVHFMYEGNIYMQIDGVAMGSPLGPVIANIFMIELENHIIPQLSHCLSNWKRYVDDTHAYVNPDKITYIIDKLNSFDENIKFTHELEERKTIPFLDVLITRTHNDVITTTVYRKSTNTDIYIHWHSHSPIEWKKTTINILLKRAFFLCSTKELLQIELDHLRNVFCSLNGYPLPFVNNMIELARKQHFSTICNDVINAEKPPSYIQMTLPYAGKQGEKVIRKMKKTLRDNLPVEIKARTAYKATKLESKFSTKDKTKFEHKNNLVYICKCPDPDCNDTYIGETNRRIKERIIDHNKRDKNSHILSHAREKNHPHVWLNDFKVLDTNYKSNVKRKISEALYIKSLKPSLNIQDKSFPLKLFN